MQNLFVQLVGVPKTIFFDGGPLKRGCKQVSDTDCRMICKTFSLSSAFFPSAKGHELMRFFFDDKLTILKSTFHEGRTIEAARRILNSILRL